MEIATIQCGPEKTGGRAGNTGAWRPDFGVSGYNLRELVAYYPSLAEWIAEPVRRPRLDGGRDRDRTCDPYDVNVVLSR